MQDARALPCELQHFLERQAIQTARVGDDAWVGGVHAVDVGEDLTFVSLQCDGERDCGGVGTTAANRCNVAVSVDALKSRHDWCDALVECGAETRRLDVVDARLRVDVGG
jgi:hypothetical protein